MGQSKKDIQNKKLGRHKRNIISVATQKMSTFRVLSSFLKKIWKVILGIGVLVGMATGVIYIILSFSNKVETVVFPQPRFSEQIEQVEFSFGEGGITLNVGNISRLRERPVWPCNFQEFKPIKLYAKDNIVYADVEVYAGSGMPPIKIIGNTLSGKPKEWDFNSNNNAIEIVNEKGKPVYQFYYKTPSHIVVNGIFPFPGGFVLARPEGGTDIVQTVNALVILNIKPIFRYPSWKYPGEYADGT